MSHHVLVPMDRSEPARHALETALTTFDDARITVLHVTNPVEDTYFTAEEDYYARFDVLEEEAEERAEAVLSTARDIADDFGRDIDTATAIGQPGRAIVEIATEDDVTHIVIGSHGRSGISRLLLGSVAEAVVRRAPVPVTVVKGDIDDD